MIITVTLNAAIDKTLVCNGLELGSITRAQEALAVAGGKGINVARTIHRLKGEAIATGLVGDATGSNIRKLLAEEGIRHRFTEIADNSRVCLALTDEQKEMVTEVHEPAPVVAKEEWARFQRLLGDLAPEASFITFNGSLPRGLEPSAYAELMGWCRRYNPDCKLVLDTSGAALRAGIKARPYMIKPNESEIRDLCGNHLAGVGDYVPAVRKLMAEGIELVLLSLGSAGLVFGYQAVVYQTEPITVTDVKSTVGCGDALVGGVVRKLEEGADVLTAVKYGVAAATSNLTTKSPGDIDLNQVEEIYPEVRIRPIG